MVKMEISNNGIKLIKQFEGCKLTAYKDSAGVPTIGYGHTAGVKMGQTITQTQADAYLKKDCARAEAAVNKYNVIYRFNQNQFDALVSFAFNIGNIDQLTDDGARSIATIAGKIEQYNKAGGKVLAGLTKRRSAEKALFVKPCVTATVSSQIVREFQSAYNADNGTRLTVDGIAGPKTKAAISGTILKAKWSEDKRRYTLGSKGELVKLVQRCVGITGQGIDGLYGAGTRLSVIAWQGKNGLTDDGCVGPNTLNKMLGI